MPSLKCTTATVLPTLSAWPFTVLTARLHTVGVHWWYHTPSHAAELTAGYYNTDGSSGYRELMGVCADAAAGVILTCVEMTDAQHPPEALCGPEALLRQVRELAREAGLRIGGALPLAPAAALCDVQVTLATLLCALYIAFAALLRQVAHEAGLRIGGEFPLVLAAAMCDLQVTLATRDLSDGQNSSLTAADPL
jgi:hypothetical protein